MFNKTFNAQTGVDIDGVWYAGNTKAAPPARATIMANISISLQD